MRFPARHHAAAIHYLDRGTVLCGTALTREQFHGGSTTTLPLNVTCASCVRPLLARVAVRLLSLSPGELDHELRRVALLSLDDPLRGWAQWRLRRAAQRSAS